MIKEFIINNKKKLEFRKQLRTNQTPQEKILWARLRRKGTNYKWRRQVSVGKYIADFYCPSQKLIIEIDGSQHIQAKEYDTERDAHLQSLNLKVLRFFNNEINNNIEGVMLAIYKALENSK